MTGGSAGVVVPPNLPPPGGANVALPPSCSSCSQQPCQDNLATAVGGVHQSYMCGVQSPHLSSSAPSGGGVSACAVQDNSSSRQTQPEAAIQINIFTQLDDRGPRTLHRLCRLTVKRLVINKPVQSGPLSSIYIAVQMQNSNKKYRSPELQVTSSHPAPQTQPQPPPDQQTVAHLPAGTVAGGAVGHHQSHLIPTSAMGVVSSSPNSSDQCIDIYPNFQVEMVYSHHVKKDGGGGGMGGSGGRNHLVIFVQRRNRIKGTTVLGYKNIAACSIDMSLVLQRGSTVQLEYDLISSSSAAAKDRSNSANSAASSSSHHNPLNTPHTQHAQPPGAVVSVSSNPEVVGRIYLGQLSTAPFEAPQDSRGHVNASKDPSQGSSSARRAKDITYLQGIRRRATNRDRTSRGDMGLLGSERESPRTRATTLPQHLSDEFDSEMDSLSDPDEDFPPAPETRARRKKQQRQHRSNNLKQKVFAVLKKMNQRHEGVGGGPDHEEDCLGPDDDILADDFDDLDEFDSNSDMEDSIGESNSLESFQISEWYRKPEIKPFFNNSQVELAEPSDERVSGGAAAGEPFDTDPAVQTSDGNTRLNSDEDRLAGVKGVGGGVVCKAGAPSCSPEPHAHHQCDDVTCEVLKNQLNSVFGTAANPVPSSSLPKCVVIGADHDLLCNALQEKQACKVFKTRSHSDILLILDKIVNMLKNMLYSHASRNVPVLRVLVVGPERYISFTLQYFVELFSKKSQDLPKHVQFLILPANTHFTMLRSLDRLSYFEKFSEYANKLEQQPQAGASQQTSGTAASSSTGGTGVGCEVGGIGSLLEHVVQYIESPKSTVLTQLPISEALLHFLKSEDNSTNQQFVPFLNYLRIGGHEDSSSTAGGATASASIPIAPAVTSSASGGAGVTLGGAGEEDEDEKCHPPSPPDNAPHLQHVLEGVPSASSVGSLISGTIAGSAAPNSTFSAGDTATGVAPNALSDQTGVTSQGMGCANQDGALAQQQQTSSGGGQSNASSAVTSAASASEFQIDVWDNKNDHQQTIKGYITYLRIERVSSSGFTLQIVSREKKKGISGIKIKKNKDKQDKQDKTTRLVELTEVTRLLCSCKAPSSATMNVTIDGCDYNGVKFFQVTTQWPTHLKTFPVLTPGALPSHTS